MPLVCRTRKIIFGIHDPVGVHYLFQLRLGLSPLYPHKRRYNFADTPSDCCSSDEGIEDVNHFILDCSNFINERVVLLLEVNNIFRNNRIFTDLEKSDIYLYGHHELSYSANEKLLLATINFIKCSKRISSWCNSSPPSILPSAHLGV